MPFSCGYLFSQPAVKQVLSVWLSLPLSDLSLLSKVLAVFSLLLIHSFLLAVPSSCYQSILESPSSRFSCKYFHSSLLNTSPSHLGYAFKQVHKPIVTLPPAPTLPTTPALPFCKMAMARQRASKGWCLLFKINLKYLTIKLFTQGLMSVGLQSISRGSANKETVLG